MTNEIRIYVEGGRQGKEPRAAVRNGFHGFLKDIISLARSKRIRFYIIPCGHSSSTFEDFQTALRSHPDAFNILLVDSDSAVTTNPREHLRNHKNWDLSHISDEQCQLMVQITEAWMVADITTLENYYGQDFHKNAIPKTADVEQIEKDKLLSSLKSATRKTQKGEYHKIRHGPEILKQLNADKVRSAARHCELLFATLERIIDS